MDELKKEFEFYLAKKPEYLLKYKGKFIVLRDQRILGVYDDRLEAIKETAKTYPIGTFLVQQVVEVEEEVRFHSRTAV